MEEYNRLAKQGPSNAEAFYSPGADDIELEIPKLGDFGSKPVEFSQYIFWTCTSSQNSGNDAMARPIRSSPIGSSRFQLTLFIRPLSLFSRLNTACNFFNDRIPHRRKYCARIGAPDPRPWRDAFIAATAHVRGLVQVARNVGDFRELDVEIMNPWDQR